MNLELLTNIRMYSITAAKGECEDSRLPAANRVQRVTIPEVFRHK